MTPLLEVAEVSVSFGGVAALQAVSFRVDPGTLLGLIGPNGAGKTTMLRVITGVVRPHHGRVVLAGRDIGALPIHARVRLGLGLSQQLVRPFASMTVRDNVALAAGMARTRSPWTALLGLDRSSERRRAEALLALVGIADVADALPGSLPLGHLKRLELARALALEPRLLLLDEPLAGLNHIEAQHLADTIRSLAGERLTVILIEHNLSEVLRICTRLVVLDNGRRIAAGVPEAVMREAAVRAAYLGEETHAAA